MIDYEKVSEILKPLAHPHRLEIVIGLLNNDCTVTQCTNRMELPQSTISQHLRILKGGGIIKAEKTGTLVKYQVVNQLAIKFLRLIEKETKNNKNL